jgi:hypothetical protein
MHYGAVAGRIRTNSLISDLCEGVESMNERSASVGCTTVIASPWPIDSRIPSHCLPASLKLGMRGYRLLMRCLRQTRE